MSDFVLVKQQNGVVVKTAGTSPPWQRGIYSFETLSEAQLDLSAPDRAIALVTDDVDPNNRTFYRKVGVSGAGVWSRTTVLDALISLAAQAEANAETAAAAVISLLGNPDPFPQYNQPGENGFYSFRFYAEEPANPVFGQPYLISPTVSAELTNPSGGYALAVDNIEVTFGNAVNPATVTNVGDGTGSFEVYDLSANVWISGALSTVNNRVWTFNPTQDMTEEHIIQVRINQTVATPAPVRGYDGVVLSFLVSPPDLIAPVVTGFAVADGVSPLTVTVFTATDNVAVTGYLITESADAPDPGAAGWTQNAPATYSTESLGSVTLYGWAKDAFDNVSQALTDAVEITGVSYITIGYPSAPLSDTGSIAADNTGVTQRIAQSFILPQGTTKVTSVIANLRSREALSGANQLGTRCFICADNSGAPDHTNLIGAAGSQNYFDSDEAFVTKEYLVNATGLTGGQKYWAVFEVVGATASGSFYATLGGDLTGNPYADGKGMSKSGAGAWSDMGGGAADLYVQISCEP